MGSDSATSLSLLVKLKNGSNESRGWDEFVVRYQPRIFDWCRRWGLQECDAQDVTQNVMLELAQQIKKFEYKAGGKFRSWLRTVVRRAWYDYTMRKKKVEFQAQHSGFWNELSSEEAENDLLQRLEDECNRELLEVAIEKVKQRVEKQTWQAFAMTELEQLPVDLVVHQTGLSKASVYVARGRIQKMLLKEVEKLDRM